MTPKQAEKLQKKIADIKRVLAAEKRKFGGYDDSRGLRYLPTEYYIKLADYAGGLRYLRWFARQFPDDAGFPDFLFECTILLFKGGKIKEAEKKAVQTFCSNTYLLDHFLGKDLVLTEQWEWSNLATAAFAQQLVYSGQQPELADFRQWLDGFVTSGRFGTFSVQYLKLNRQLKDEADQEKRSYLVAAKRKLEEEF